MPEYLRFSQMANNAKLKGLIPHCYERGYYGQHLVFNLPAGHTCRQAKHCRAQSDEVTGKIINGPHQIFRCYAASIEARSRNMRTILHDNRRLLEEADARDGTHAIIQLIEASLMRAGGWDNGSVIRIHSHGDFFNPHYLHAWSFISTFSPRNHYYAYTKAVAWAIDLRRRELWIPENLSLTMSRGGTEDHLIPTSGFKEAVVVGSEEEAHDLGLEIDHDDSHACFGTESFALLIHGSGNAHLKGTRMQLVKEEL